jgi:hypothetical protein
MLYCIRMKLKEPDVSLVGGEMWMIAVDIETLRARGGGAREHMFLYPVDTRSFPCKPCLPILEYYT